MFFNYQLFLIKKISNEVFGNILIILNRNCKEVDFVSMSSEKKRREYSF